MSEEHGTLIKTPSNLSSYACWRSLTPVAIALLGAQLVTGSKRIDTTEDKKSVEQRVKPVGELVKLEGAAPAPAPAAGVVAVAAKAKAATRFTTRPAWPATGQVRLARQKRVIKAAWAPRVAQGVATL